MMARMSPIADATASVDGGCTVERRLGHGVGPVEQGPYPVVLGEDRAPGRSGVEALGRGGPAEMNHGRVSFQSRASANAARLGPAATGCVNGAPGASLPATLALESTADGGARVARRSQRFRGGSHARRRSTESKRFREERSVVMDGLSVGGCWARTFSPSRSTSARSNG